MGLTRTVPRPGQAALEPVEPGVAPDPLDPAPEARPGRSDFSDWRVWLRSVTWEAGGGVTVTGTP